MTLILMTIHCLVLFGQESLDIDSLLAVHTDDSKFEDTTRIVALGKAIELLVDTDQDSVEYWIDKHLEEAVNYDDIVWTSIYLFNYGDNRLEQDDFENAVRYLSTCIDYQLMHNDTSRLGKSYLKLGIAQYHLGRQAQASEEYDSALVWASKVNDYWTITSTNNNIGLIYNDKGDYQNALDFLSKSLDQSINYGYKDLEAEAYGNLGNVNSIMGKHDEALRYQLRSLELFKEIRDAKGEAFANTRLGIVLLDLGQFDESIKHTEKAIGAFRRIGYPRGIAAGLNSIGNNYLRRGIYDKALEYTFEVLQLQKEIGDKKGSAITLSKAGFIYQMNGQYYKAIPLYEEAITISKEIEYWYGIHNAVRFVHEAYAEIGQYDLAYESYKEFAEITDSIDNIENREKLIEIRFQDSLRNQQKIDSIQYVSKTQIQIANKENEHKLRLTRTYFLGGFAFTLLSFVFLRNRELQRQKLLAEQAETARFQLKGTESEMKALRSQMNPHFIFNALQSIQDFILSHNTDDANGYLLKFQKLMRAVLENSLHDEIPLEEDKEALEHYIQLESIRLKHPCTYSFTIDPSIDQEETYIPPLILQPLIENAIKHGLQPKDGPGHIDIQMNLRDGQLKCVIEDNGVGRQHPKSAFELRPGKRQSLGLNITEDRLKLWDQKTGGDSHIEIVDLVSEDGTPIGTRVELYISLMA